MLYYIIAIIIVVTWTVAVVSPQKRNTCAIGDVNENGHKFDLKRRYLALVLFIMVTVVAFNGDVIGVGDVASYEENYAFLRRQRFSQAIKTALEIKDSTYYIGAYLFSKLGFSFVAWRVCIEGFFCFSLYRLLSKHSVNIPVSIMVILSLGSYGFTLTALRQTLAMAILVWSYDALVNKRLIKFSCIVLLASLFHGAAIVFLLAYPCYRMKPGLRGVLIMSIVCAVIIVFGEDILKSAVMFMGKENNYSGYLSSDATLTWSGTIIYGCILLFVIVFLYLRNISPDEKRPCHLLMISWAFRLLSSIAFAEMFRFSIYFSLFDSLTIANACSGCGKTSQGRMRHDEYLIMSFAVTLFLLYYITCPSYNIVNFRFNQG